RGVGGQLQLAVPNKIRVVAAAHDVHRADDPPGRDSSFAGNLSANAFDKTNPLPTSPNRQAQVYQNASKAIGSRWPIREG
ncbi:MAG TPA: hypothetical protein VGX78_17625, partial [Pirellulales bacterium]|nr:hypothetical protein [Pirellulales bacterium]